MIFPILREQNGIWPPSFRFATKIYICNSYNDIYIYVSDVIVINTCSFQISLGLHIKHTKVIIFLLE